MMLSGVRVVTTSSVWSQLLDVCGAYGPTSSWRNCFPPLHITKN